MRSDAEYTATLVESTRAQLLADFDAWLQEEMGFGASSLPRAPAAPPPNLEEVPHLDGPSPSPSLALTLTLTVARTP